MVCLKGLEIKKIIGIIIIYLNAILASFLVTVATNDSLLGFSSFLAINAIITAIGIENEK